jgi:hypothetical protein
MTSSLLLLGAIAAAYGGGTEADVRRPVVAEKPGSPTEVAAFRVGDRYRLAVYEKIDRLTFDNQGRKTPEAWTLYYMTAWDRKTDETRRVWAVYYPIDFSARKSLKAHDFAIGIRNENEAALAYQIGAGVRIEFYEIDLSKEADPPEKDLPIVRGDTSPRPAGAGTAFVPPWAFLSTVREDSGFPIRDLLPRRAPGDGAAGDLGRGELDDLRIVEIKWLDMRWRITIKLGTRTLTFVRAPDKGWQRQRTDGGALPHAKGK